jgi:hypothetical protein
MTVFITLRKDTVFVQASAESHGKIGDVIWEVNPGQSFLDHPYEWWINLPIGKNELSL